MVLVSSTQVPQNGYLETLIFRKKIFWVGIFGIYTEVGGANKIIFIFLCAAS
jgi:hypothetical protein